MVLKAIMTLETLFFTFSAKFEDVFEVELKGMSMRVSCPEIAFYQGIVWMLPLQQRDLILERQIIGVAGVQSTLCFLLLLH